MEVTTFATWLEKEFIEWQMQVGRKTVLQFAKYLGVPQASLSEWMNGSYKPAGSKNVRALADKLGPEVYDLLGLQRPADAELDGQSRRILDMIRTTPAEHKEELLGLVENYLAGLGYHRSG